jgi:hypothetical protein
VTAQGVQRVCIRLDRAMLLEAVLIRRLALVPKARRQEWLRGLLVQGCLWETRAGRDALSTAEDRNSTPRGEASLPAPRTDHAPQPGPQRFSPRPAAEERTARQRVAPTGTSTPPKEPTGVKPFAHLRKVIG